MGFPKSLCALLCAFSTGVGVAAPNAHDHGVADLRVAVEGRSLLIEFESPLANLVGFEHAPADAAQRAALEQLAARLRAVGSLIVLPAEAGCRLEDVELDLPGHDAHAHAHKDAHAHAHGGADQGHAGEHADAFAVWGFECTDPAALSAVEVRVIEAFPAIRLLRAAVVGPSGQSAARIDAPRARLTP